MSSKFSFAVALVLSLLLHLSFLALPSYAAAGAPWTGCVKNSGTGTRILFIGHSKFYWHDMPKMLASMTQSRPMKISYVFGNSYALEDHWNTKLALKVIQNERPAWDYVVFIEKTKVPRVRPEKFEKYVKLFDKEVRRSGARTILVESYTDDVSRYKRRHEVMNDWSKKLGLPVVPVATAWNEVRTKYPKIKLYAPDGHHPSIQGTYLMNCVFYSYFLRQSPLSLPSRLNYTDRRTGSSQVFRSNSDCRAVQTAAYNAVRSMK